MTGEVMFHEFIKRTNEKEGEKRELPDEEDIKVEETSIKKKKVGKEKKSSTRVWTTFFINFDMYRIKKTWLTKLWFIYNHW